MPVAVAGQQPVRLGKQQLEIDPFFRQTNGKVLNGLLPLRVSLRELAIELPWKSALIAVAAGRSANCWTKSLLVPACWVVFSARFCSSQPCPADRLHRELPKLIWTYPRIH
jgi:hypothetical protein